MKIVIDIPEEVYKSIQDNDYCGISNSDMYNAVKNGTPLSAKTTINPEETKLKLISADGDLISRTELLNKIWQKEYGKDYDGVNLLNIPHIDIIENMPSYNSIKTELDGDLISRQAVLDILKDKWNMFSDGNDAMQESIDTIEAITSVKPHPSAEKMAERNTAEWIEVIDEIDSLGNKTWHHECSRCGNKDSGWGDYKYCPNCGSRMKGEE